MRSLLLSASVGLLTLACDGTRDDPAVVDRPPPPGTFGGGTAGNGQGGAPGGGGGGADGGAGGGGMSGLGGAGGATGVGGGVPGCIASGDDCIGGDICCDAQLVCIDGFCDLP